ncbi:MAG TPA: heavy metal translocating P-type ATPase, partial [Ramlibacter sp.]|nr:heavy metal translocating P-type ATPase [Ramlibacter sp.]
WASWMLTVPVLLFSCWPFYASAWRDLRRGRLGMDVPVALGIAIAFAASTVATFDPASPLGGEVWYDSVTMFVFFLLSGRLLEQRLRGRTAGALRALARRLPDSTLRKDPADGQFRRVPVHRLRAGDVVRVLPGETFAADGTVEAGESRVDEALLTGESLAQARTVGDAVVAGSHNLSGALEVRVSSAGNATRYAAIMALMERAAVDKPRLARIADRWAGPFLLGVLAASAASAAWWWGEGPARAVGVAIAVLVVTCPCALSLATPAATLAAAGALARRGVLVRSLRALEGGAAVDTVLFDKTGTLTEDRMAVAAVRTRQGVAPAQALGLAALLARQSLHPLSRAIAAAAGAGDSAVPGAVAAVQEIAGQGVEALHSEGGAIPQRLRLGSAGFCQAPASQHGGPQVHLADGQGWLASFELEEALRPDAAALLQRLNEAGIAFEILSGDSAHAVQHVAARLGVECARGGQSPQDKLARVQALQAQGHRVAMVGDGMNDGPVLARANLSIAMGQGVPVAQASADVVVPGGQLSSIDLLLRQAGRTRAVVRQ